MKSFRLFFTFLTIAASITKLSADMGLNAIYKNDDRRFVGITTPSKIKELSKSVAMIIGKDLFHGRSIETSKLSDQNGLNVCLDEKFSQSNSVASCTGFLVGSDLLLTAGHCFEYPTDCQDKIIVFDVYDSKSQKNNYLVKEKNTFQCKEILSRDLLGDVVMIRLDRQVTNRKSLHVRKRATVSMNEKVFMLGHPLGMPMMLSRVARVRNNANEIMFYADLDSFVGNSGSPVFNQETFEVEGILTGGQDDFIADPNNNCNRFKTFTSISEAHPGEAVTRITNKLESD